MGAGIPATLVRFQRQGIKFRLLRVWLTTLIDLIQTAPIDTSDDSIGDLGMNNPKRPLPYGYVAILFCDSIFLTGWSKSPRYSRFCCCLMLVLQWCNQSKSWYALP